MSSAFETRYVSRKTALSVFFVITLCAAAISVGCLVRFNRLRRLAEGWQQCRRMVSQFQFELTADDTIEEFEADGFVDVDHRATLRLSGERFELLRAAIAATGPATDSQAFDFHVSIPNDAVRFARDSTSDAHWRVAMSRREHKAYLYWR